MKTAATIFVAALLVAIPVEAATVQVEAKGVVEYNQVRFGIFADVNSGDPVLVSFQVDSDVFTDSPNYPTRGYAIDLDSYLMTLGTVQIGLFDPWFSGLTPYFVIRDNDPAVDGFFVSTNNVDWPWPGLYLNEWGRLDIFTNHFEVTYPGDRLPSLDILDALGLYDYDGLSVFYFTVNDDGFEPIGISYTNLTISLVPVEVPVDIKPGSCPNPFNVTASGKLPVAIMGTPDLDVTAIDPASIRLEGFAPLRSSYEDVGAPFEPYVGKEACERDCHEWEPDGWMDLTLKFSRQEIVAALGDVVNHECLPLSLTGNFVEEYGGGPIVGEDLILIINVGGRRDGPVAPADDRLSRPVPRQRMPEMRRLGVERH